MRIPGLMFMLASPSPGEDRDPGGFRAGSAVKVKMHGWPVLLIAFLTSFLTFPAVFLVPLPRPWLLRRSLTSRNVFLA